jgi:hypothetical protein
MIFGNKKMPNIGMVPMIDAETGETQLIDTSSKTVRFNYEKYYNDQLVYFKHSVSQVLECKYQSRRKLCDQIIRLF